MATNASRLALPPWLAGFGRITSGGRFLPVVDGLRFVAIAFVLLYHLNDYVVHAHPEWTREQLRSIPLFNGLNVGNCGVQLFFIISGFILGLPLIEARLGQRNPVGLKPYFLRRVTRLEPPYLINLVIALTLLVVVKHQSLAELWPHFLASVTYLHNLVYGAMSEINGVCWSLEIEVQFYILAPLLAAVLFSGGATRRRMTLGLAIAGLIAMKMVLGDSLAGRARLSLIYWLDDFLAGFLLADLFATATDREHRSFAWDAASLVGWPAVVASQWNETTYHLLAPAAMVAYAGACRGRASHWVLSRPLIVVIGGMCYTIYLYHFYVISLVGRAALPLTAGLSYPSAFAVMTVLVVPPALLVSAVLFRIFERPFMAWKPWKVEERLRIVEPVRFETPPELLSAPSGLAKSEAHHA